MSILALSNGYRSTYAKVGKLLSDILYHSGRTDVNGGHLDLLNRSGLGFYHYHHGLGSHLHPCEYGVEYYNLEEPTYGRKIKLGFAILKDSNNVNYFPIRRVLPALPLTQFTDINKKLQIITMQQYSKIQYDDVRHHPIEINIDYSAIENEMWLPQTSITIQDGVTSDNLDWDLGIYYKNNELHISVEDAMKIINLDNYYKRVSLDSQRCYHFEITTQEHEDLNKKKEEYNVSNTVVWTAWKAIEWKLQNVLPGDQTPEIYSHDFKILWISTYKDVIKAAANEYDIPELLLAGVMYVEVAGQPPIFDDLTYFIRDTFMPSIVEGVANIGALASGVFERLPGRDIATSFGDISMQIRVGAEVLNYPTPNHLCKEEIYAIIDSLKVPEIGLFMCAKHLQNLKNLDYPQLSLDELTDERIRITGSRYNRGAGLTLGEIRNDTTYGDRIINNKTDIMEALELKE